MYKATLKGRINSRKTLILVAILRADMTDYKKIKLFPYAYFGKSIILTIVSFSSICTFN